MPVIAIVNRKGGSGKSTLATHLAACFANRGLAVMLGDVDRQQSTQGWLKMRAAEHLPGSAPIVGWAVDPKRVLRPPAGVSLVVLDTPGGLHGFDLARVVAFADAILMPVCNSSFDRESAAECHAELMTLPRVASGRCKVVAVGMRLDARTRSGETLAAWARDRRIPFVAALREAQVYVRGIERGVTLFDVPAEKVAADRAQWQPLVEWLEPVLNAVHKPAIRGHAEVRRTTPAVLGPVVEPAVAARSAGVASAGSGRSASGVEPLPRLRATVRAEPRRRSTAERLAGWLGWLTTPKVRRPSAS